MKRILYAGLFIAAGLFITFLIFNESLPSGEKGAEAELLADKILNAIDFQAWDSIPIVQWSFRGEHHYIWDKQLHAARVLWEDYEAFVDINAVNGVAAHKGILLEGAAAEKAVRQAWEYWCNDSFWLNAPAKVRDAGTERSLVKLSDGRSGLLVTYASGGVTPGDAYLWVTDSTGLPEYYQMWVKIIPIGGVKATWQNWIPLRGALIATSHRLGPFSIEITNLKAGDTPMDFGLEQDAFSRLFQK